MAIPARKYDFDSIVQVIPILTPGEKETLEIMLHENLYCEIENRRKEFHKEVEEDKTFSIEEVLKEIDED